MADTMDGGVRTLIKVGETDHRIEVDPQVQALLDGYRTAALKAYDEGKKEIFLRLGFAYLVLVLGLLYVWSGSPKLFVPVIAVGELMGIVAGILIYWDSGKLEMLREGGNPVRTRILRTSDMILPMSQGEFLQVVQGLTESLEPAEAEEFKIFALRLILILDNEELTASDRSFLWEEIATETHDVLSKTRSGSHWNLLKAAIICAVHHVNELHVAKEIKQQVIAELNNLSREIDPFFRHEEA